MTEDELRNIAEDVRYIKKSLVVINRNIGQILSIFIKEEDSDRVKKLKKAMGS